MAIRRGFLWVLKWDFIRGDEEHSSCDESEFLSIGSEYLVREREEERDGGNERSLQ